MKLQFGSSGKQLIVLMLVVILQGCYMLFPSDGGFKVNGSIKNDQNEPIGTCTIELRDAEGKIWWQPRAIPSEFDDLFTVAPYPAQYLLIIDCQGYEPKQIVVNYGKEVSPTEALSLGTVSMDNK